MFRVGIIVLGLQIVLVSIKVLLMVRKGKRYFMIG